MLPKVLQTKPTKQFLDPESIAGIMNFLEQPTLLISDRQRAILSANIAALELSEYPTNELLGSRITTLFPNIIGRNNPIHTLQNLPGQSLATVLITRSREHIPVNIRLQTLDDQEFYHLLSFEPIAKQQRRQTMQERRSAELTIFNDLLKILLNPFNVESFAEILNIGRQLLITNALAIYLCEHDAPIFRLETGWGNTAILPNEISPNDIQHLLTPLLWASGQRSVVTMLHHAVRVADYAFLASTPIESQNGANLGLLVTVGQEKPDWKRTLPILQILAAAISVGLQHQLLKTNLEQQIHQQQIRLAVGNTLQESTNEGTIIISPTLEIQSINPAAELILGYATQEVRGKEIENVLIGSDRIIPAIKLALQGIPTHSLGKVTLHRRDGRSFPAQIQITPVQSKEQEHHVLVLLNDHSEHEQSKLRTHQLEQRALLGDVSAVFAHEVRNPINNISMGLQLLSITLPEDNENQETLTRIQQDFTRLTDLMESILTFSRTGNYEFGPICLQTIIEKILKRWQPRFLHLGIQSHVKISPNTPDILGDKRSLDQVFTNLISNAVHAMDNTGGTLAIRISPRPSPGGKVHIQVDISDTGPGIPDEIRDRIFEPFFTTDPKGTGLGLAITKQIITAHKGNIELSTFPGGTLFHIQLPALEKVEEILS